MLNRSKTCFLRDDLHNPYHCLSTLQIASIDACVLTHGHADAIFGLDDLRGVQPPPTNDSLPIYLSQYVVNNFASPSFALLFRPCVCVLTTEKHWKQFDAPFIISSRLISQ